MDKSKKVYIKALDKYNNGLIDRAIELCEESISIDIKNAASINLKGLLCYLKGDLDNAQRLWKMNKQTNKDSIAERYLEDVKKDAERLKFYKLALDFINNIKVQEAINLLEKCAESDFNYINVNNNLALCYMKKGEYDKVIEYIEKVFLVDKNNMTAKEIRKELQRCGVVKKKANLLKKRYMLAISACLIACILFFFISPTTGNKYSLFTNKFFSKSVSPIKEQVSKNKEGTVKSENNKVNNSKIQVEVFPADKLKADINSKSFESIYDVFFKWRDKELTVNDKVILSNAEEILKTEGVDYFYNKGFDYINNKNYLYAKEYLLKAYTLGEKHYLYPHIVYMLGTSFHLLGDEENTIKYYTQYDQAFSGGEYEETVLYSLAIIYKNLDMSNAKKYSKKLAENYPSSIYNNSVVKELTNN